MWCGGVNWEAHNVVWRCQQGGSKCSVAVSKGELKIWCGGVNREAHNVVRRCQQGGS